MSIYGSSPTSRLLSPILNSSKGQESTNNNNKIMSSVVKNLLDRTHLTLNDRLFEVTRILMPSSARYSSSSHSFNRSFSNKQQQQQQNLTMKDLDEIFVLLIGDIFGSAAVRAGKYGQGWNLVGLTRSKNYRDYNAVLNFLSPNGPLMHCIDALMHDPMALYEYPAARLPFSYLRQTQTKGFLMENSSNESLLLTPFEYYMFHFAAAINQSSEWYQTNGIENDSLYPVVLEEYLTVYLPIGGGHFHYQTFELPQQPAYSNSNSFNHNKSSLLRNDNVKTCSAGGSPAAYGSPRIMGSSGHTNKETWKSGIFVDVLTKFWLLTWVDESRERRDAPRIPSSDVVKMVRMFIKHLHFFFNCFFSHNNSLDLRDSLRNGMFREFFESLQEFLNFLFDHWPLDGSFRMVLETWLSFIQPWRYQDPSLGEREAGTYEDNRMWDSFIRENINYYNQLFFKIMTRFAKLDMKSQRNSFMLFRVTKVFAQPGLAENLKRILHSQDPSLHLRSPPPNFTTMGYNSISSNQNSFMRQQEFQNIFDDNFKNFMRDIFANVTFAKSSLLAKERELNKKETKKKSSNFLGRVLSFLTLDDITPNLELEETRKTIQNLEFVQNKLWPILLPGEEPQQVDETVVDGGSEMGKFHDESMVLTPQKRWEIVNKMSKYSPKFMGNPDRMPLRSDEVHCIARLLHRLSGKLNVTLNVERNYAKKGIFGSCLRQICQPAVTYRTKVANAINTYEFAELPPRLVLRPLASHQFLTYFLTSFMLLCVLGKQRMLKLLFIVFTCWLGKLFYSMISNNESGSSEDNF